MIKKSYASFSGRSTLTKLFCLGIIVFFQAACSFTSYSTSPACITDFTVGQKVLVAELERIPVNTSYNLFEKSLEIFKKAGLSPSYAVEDELNLRLYQVQLSNADSVSLALLKDKLGYDYLLVPAVTNRRTGESVVHYDPDEVTYFSEIDAYEDTESRATVSFKLYSTKDRKLIFEVAATTKTNAMAFPEKDGDKVLYNLTSSEDAMFKAYRKGVKKILKECECCSGVNL